jgi:hypothetical protein
VYPLKFKIGFLVMIALLPGCFPNRAFVPAGFDPLLVENKGDFTISASARPFKFAHAGLTYMPVQNLVVRAGCSGFAGLSIFEGSVLFSRRFSKIGLFAGPYYNYQSNQISRHYSFEFWSTGKTYAYDCIFSSPAFVFGIKLGAPDRGSHQLVFKAGYNQVLKYSYNYESDNASGKDVSYQVNDDETLNYPQLPDFFSYEGSYTFVNPINDHLFVTFQGGFNICQAVYAHHYSYQTTYYGNPPPVSKTTFHPVTKPIFISFGLTYRFRGHASVKAN